MNYIKLYTNQQTQIKCNNDVLLILLTKTAAGVWPEFSLSLRTLFHEYLILFDFYTIHDSTMQMDAAKQQLKGRKRKHGHVSKSNDPFLWYPFHVSKSNDPLLAEDFNYETWVFQRENSAIQLKRTTILHETLKRKTLLIFDHSYFWKFSSGF